MNLLDNKLRPIAIHLPQFHPIPENDKWWGKGFTEWTNVAKSKPLFRNHYQPQLPSDLGFYDLRLEESILAQIEIARSHGINGFCFYHYWFKGKRLLEKPVNKIVENNNLDFPFCLFWANESWSRRWLGEEKEILIKQDYSHQDDVDHANFLAGVFENQRYIKVYGRPVFVIYRPLDLPSPSATIQVIKEITFKKIGIEPFIVASNSHCQDSKRLFSYGFDNILNFRPQLGVLPNAFNDEFSLKRIFHNLIKHRVLSGELKIYDYSEALSLMQRLEPESFDNVIPCAFVGWDNTPRRGKKGIIIKGNTTELFKQELLRLKSKIGLAKNNSNLLFINACNEWAEGNHLEPDFKNGDTFLSTIKYLNQDA